MDYLGGLFGRNDRRITPFARPEEIIYGVAERRRWGASLRSFDLMGYERDSNFGRKELDWQKYRNDGEMRELYEKIYQEKM